MSLKGVENLLFQCRHSERESLIYSVLCLYTGKWEDSPSDLSIGVRFSPISNGVVGKLRDSRGNGLAGETPQSFSSRRLAVIPAGKRVASPPLLTLKMATNPSYLEIESYTILAYC